MLFSGVAAFKIAVGTLAVAITNGAADTLTRSLALELAPIRVNAISPGVIDTGAWDALGEERKAACTPTSSRRNPAGASDIAEDIASAVLFCPDQHLPHRHDHPRRRRRRTHLTRPQACGPQAGVVTGALALPSDRSPRERRP